MYLFGSILTDKFNDTSDIDMLIQFSQIDVLTYFDNYMDLKDALENLFQRDVDLVEIQAIRNPIFRQVIEREKKWCMNEKVLKYLYDIKLAIDEIDTFFLTREKRYDDYKNDIVLKRAI